MPTTTTKINPAQQITNAVCPNRELTKAYSPITTIAIKIIQNIVRDAKGTLNRFIPVNLCLYSELRTQHLELLSTF